MKIDKKLATENCHFHSREKSLYVAWACFRNGHPFFFFILFISVHLYIILFLKKIDFSHYSLFEEN